MLLIVIAIQIYRLYRVRAYRESSYFWSISKLCNRKIKNIDKFVKIYTYFSVFSIIVLIILIIIVQFVKMEYINTYLSVVASLSVPIGIVFYFKLKNS